MLKALISICAILAIGLFIGLHNHIHAVPQPKAALQGHYTPTHPGGDARYESRVNSFRNHELGLEDFIEEPMLEAKTEVAIEPEPVVEQVQPTAYGVLSLLTDSHAQASNGKTLNELLDIDLTALVERDLRSGTLQVGKIPARANASLEATGTAVEYNVDDVIDRTKVQGETITLQKARVSLRNE